MVRMSFNKITSNTIPFYYSYSITFKAWIFQSSYFHDLLTNIATCDKAISSCPNKNIIMLHVCLTREQYYQLHTYLGKNP